MLEKDKNREIINITSQAGKGQGAGQDTHENTHS